MLNVKVIWPFIEQIWAVESSDEGNGIRLSSLDFSLNIKVIYEMVAGELRFDGAACDDMRRLATFHTFPWTRIPWCTISLANLIILRF